MLQLEQNWLVIRDSNEMFNMCVQEYLFTHSMTISPYITFDTIDLRFLFDALSAS